MLHYQCDQDYKVMQDNLKDLQKYLDSSNIKQTDLDNAVQNIILQLQQNPGDNTAQILCFDDTALNIRWIVARNPAGFTITADIEHKPASADLDAQQIIEQIPNALFWKNEKSEFMGCNKLFAGSAGFTSTKDIIGKTDYDMPWGKKYAEKYILDDQKIMHNQQAKLNYEERQTMPTGEQIDILVSKTPVQLADDSRGILGIYTDISDRKRYERELSAAKDKAEDSDRKKSQFLAIISHELRTPLSAIKGGVDIIKLNHPDENNETLDNISKASNHLLKLVEDVIDLVKSTESKLAIRREPIIINDIIDQCYELAKHKSNNKIKIIRQNHIDIPGKVLGDATRIKQVIVNLIDNAIKYTESGSVNIIAKSEQAGDTVRLRVSIKDTGCGIDKDKQKFVFDQFTQIPQGPEYYTSGFGLGLSICKYLALNMGGKIILASELGKGSEFTFEVPLKIAPTRELDDNKTNMQRKNTALHKRFLLVEDNELNRMVITSLLDKLGAEVDCAKNGAEALKAIANNSYDIILMDIGLPDTNGVDLTKKIRTKHKTQAIYALTAHALAAENKEMLQLFDKIIVKPVGIDDLHDMTSS
jgi:two-component system, OmpR family, aerobic respiration control sensor histidine kinase ArcB